MMYSLCLPERRFLIEMVKIIGLVKRNMLIYFKDKSAVFFSMLTPIIVLLIYLLFMKMTFVNSITGAAESLLNFISDKDIDSFANGFLLVGILGSAMITVPYNTLSTIVKDRENGVDSDMCVTPVRRTGIVLAYFIASALSAFIMTTVIMTAGLVILQIMNPMYMSVRYIVYLYLTVLLGSISGTAVFMPVMMLIKTQSVSGSVMGIVSAISGFVIGAYLPISEFSDRIQTICNLFPATGVTVMLRYFCLTGILDEMDRKIGGVDGGAFAESLRSMFSFRSNFFGREVSIAQTSIYVMAATAVFLGILMFVYPKVYKKR